jgi:hypothetical protein
MWLNREPREWPKHLRLSSFTVVIFDAQRSLVPLCVTKKPIAKRNAKSREPMEVGRVLAI